MSGLKLALVAAVICTSASRQISSTFSRRSESVRKPRLYCSWTWVDHVLVRGQDLGLALLGDHDVVLGDGHRGARGVAEPDRLEDVEQARDLGGAVGGHELVDEGGEPLLGDVVVDERVARRLEVVFEQLAQAVLDLHVEDRPADRGDDALPSTRRSLMAHARELGDAGGALHGHLALVEQRCS